MVRWQDNSDSNLVTEKAIRTYVLNATGGVVVLTETIYVSLNGDDTTGASDRDGYGTQSNGHIIVVKAYYKFHQWQTGLKEV